jgi:GNAT superfamily N-acetyltransferase
MHTRERARSPITFKERRAALSPAETAEWLVITRWRQRVCSAATRRERCGAICRTRAGDSAVLAVDQKDQGLGLGKHPLRDAIARCVQVADIIGVRAMLVHALHDDARRFYAYFDFRPSPTDPLHLLLPIQDASDLLGR